MIVSALPPGSQALQVVPDPQEGSRPPRKAVAAAAVAAVLWWPLSPPGPKEEADAGVGLPEMNDLMSSP